jgi:hypothetical protein
MKKLAAAVFLALLIQVGISGTANADPPPGTPIVLTDTFTDHFTDFVLDHPCTGEPVVLSGTATTLLHFTNSEQLVNFRQLFTIHGTGVGTISGEMYTFQQNFSDVSNTDFSDFSPFSQTFGPIPTTFVATGEEPDFRANTFFHLVATPSGQQTIVEFGDASCM